MTIYDIAKIAGVSASSVSRVVNGKPGVNSATREKIQALLKEHNYVPDTNARNLVTQSNKTIGILTDDLDTAHQMDGCHHLEKCLHSLRTAGIIQNAKTAWKIPGCFLLQRIPLPDCSFFVLRPRF